MGLLKKMFAVLLVFSFLFLQFPKPGLAKFYVKANASTTITENAPQIFSTPEIDIPIVQEAEPPKKGNTLTYLVGGLLLVGILVAALSGGGGGGDEPPPRPGSDSGNYNISW